MLEAASLLEFTFNFLHPLPSFSPRGPRLFSLARKLFDPIPPRDNEIGERDPLPSIIVVFLLSLFFFLFPSLPPHFRRETIRKTERSESTDLNAVIVDNISEAALYPSSNYIGVAAPAELGK